MIGRVVYVTDQSRNYLLVEALLRAATEADVDIVPEKVSRGRISPGGAPDIWSRVGWQFKDVPHPVLFLTVDGEHEDAKARATANSRLKAASTALLAQARKRHQQVKIVSVAFNPCTEAVLLHFPQAWAELKLPAGTLTERLRQEKLRHGVVNKRKLMDHWQVEVGNRKRDLDRDAAKWVARTPPEELFADEPVRRIRDEIREALAPT